ncbi:MYC1-like protein [Mya arenaria]|uniref:MYC1-like protein n=1 Tax=Mya arenaria TaxID=6604 RepID=A0ABY7FPW6_MYAAR|nr:transcriptional regulator Myc-A-like [Mya arenaria]XP_052776107.1 transcriptional regulator Myc-A-like [Mya arenaria]WAR22924.1 MYC1-like protein [Mya arenaria]WAR22925.1 MYC1-like protein [Mya arenaria]
MGIRRITTNFNTDMHMQPTKRFRVAKMDNVVHAASVGISDIVPSIFDDVELHNSPTSMTSEDIWKKFDLPTPPLSPQHEGEDDWDLENITMPFDIDTEDLLLFDDEKTNELLKDVASVFPESPPGVAPDIETFLQSNLIQDIMWSAPAKADDSTSAKVPCSENQRSRCDSCSNPMSTACVAPDEILMETNLGGTLSQTKVHSLGIETPSDSEEEIDVVTVAEKFVSVPTTKRKYRSDDEYSSSGAENRKPRTVTLTIEHKASSSHNISKCAAVRQKVDCPTDVHNYSLPLSSLKRVHSYPSSPVTHKSKKLRRDISIPSELRKVAQKLKSCSSRSSSDSEDLCDVGKRTQHNVLERKRRTDLKNSFFHLRDSVPDLEGQERAPKVVILRKASQYINRLIEEQRQKDREIEQLKLRKEKLKRHLSRLRDY